MAQQVKFVSYLRVSSKRQGVSGLGLEAQHAAISSFVQDGHWQLVKQFVEVESGKRADRPQLVRALSECRIHGATLVVAKLDRLARNAHFLLSLQAAGVEFVAADMPSANRLTVGILALIAEEEGRMISLRTKEALAAAKKRGTRLGNPRNLTNEARSKGSLAGVRSRQTRAIQQSTDIAPILEEIRVEGAGSLRQIAKALNGRGIPAARGGDWTAIQVSRLLTRLQSATS